MGFINLKLHMIKFGYNLFYVIWDNVAYFPDDTHKSFQIAYFTMFSVNIVIMIFECISIILVIFSSLKRKKEKKIKKD